MLSSARVSIPVEEASYFLVLSPVSAGPNHGFGNGTSVSA